MRNNIYKQVSDGTFNELVNRSFLFDKEVTWLTFTGKLPVNDYDTSYKNVSLDLYSGISGILYFLKFYKEANPDK